jgi:methylaspartate ammonia-lyase
MLEGRPLASFRQLAAQVDTLTETAEEVRPVPRKERNAAPPSRRDLLTAPARLWRAAQSEGETAVERVAVERRLHAAVRYGVSQALLAAVALAHRLTMAEAIAAEWGLPVPDAPIPIQAQPGGERTHDADRMIARRVVSLAHDLIDNIPDQLGQEGDKLVQYARWLKQRIRRLGGDAYRPTIHLDVHGTLGQIFDNNLGRVLGQLHALELAVQPYPLRVASPVIQDSREAQIEAMKTLRDYVRFRHMQVQLVAGEWADTLDDIRAFAEAGAADLIQVKMPAMGSVHNAVEAVLACRAAGVGVLLGGSCADTDLSARVAVHVALATRPDLIMTRPGTGVDEAISLKNDAGVVLRLKSMGGGVQLNVASASGVKIEMK